MLFWYLMAYHAINLWLQRLALADGWALPDISWDIVKVASSLSTFFVVFYAGSCYTRFFQLYDHCVNINGLIIVWASLIVTHFGNQGLHFKWNLMRLYLAGMHTHYYLLHGEHKLSENGVTGKGLSTSEWTMLGQYLRTDEAESLQSFSGFKPYVAQDKHRGTWQGAHAYIPIDLRPNPALGHAIQRD